MNLDFEMANNIIKISMEKEREEKLYSLWLVELQSMDKNTYMDFHQYKIKSKLKNISKSNTEVKKKKSLEELEKEAKIMKEKFKKGEMVEYAETMESFDVPNLK